MRAEYPVGTLVEGECVFPFHLQFSIHRTFFSSLHLHPPHLHWHTLELVWGLPLREKLPPGHSTNGPHCWCSRATLLTPCPLLAACSLPSVWLQLLLGWTPTPLAGPLHPLAGPTEKVWSCLLLFQFPQSLTWLPGKEQRTWPSTSPGFHVGPQQASTEVWKLQIIHVGGGSKREAWIQPFPEKQLGIIGGLWRAEPWLGVVQTMLIIILKVGQIERSLTTNFGSRLAADETVLCHS